VATAGEAIEEGEDDGRIAKRGQGQSADVNNRVLRQFERLAYPQHDVTGILGQDPIQPSELKEPAMIRRTIKYGAAIVLMALSLAGAYRAGVYQGSWRGAQDGYNKGYLQGRKDAIPEGFINKKPNLNSLFLQAASRRQPSGPASDRRLFSN
jgi:hypothetical protein